MDCNEFYSDILWVILYQVSSTHVGERFALYVAMQQKYIP